MACRDMGKAEEAAKYIHSEIEGVEGAGTVETVLLDLASLTSVRRCAQELLQKLEKIHLLVNNAGMCVFRTRTCTDCVLLLSGAHNRN
jgi:NAD(P)-dependent dehydrogenase (short-subunit alcohol dehydrogenase family)